MERNTEELFEHFKFVVDPNQTTMRIDKFLMGKLEKVSRSTVQKGITEGLVLVNGDTIKSSYKVRPLDVIQIYLEDEKHERQRAQGENIPLDIRYEDDDLMVIYKPPGLVVHPGVGNWTGTLVNGLVYYLQNKELPVLAGNDVDRPGLVHRIDKDTSGLLVVAKTEMAMTALGKQFFDHSIEREYVALVWGTPEPEKGTIDANIGRNPKDRFRMFVFPENEGGKHAVTHYETLESLYYVSVVKCKLETGRTHQIRVHLSYMGNPLFNDAKYNGDAIRKGTVFSKYKQFVNNCFDILPRHALHAQSLGFIHPRTGEKMYFKTELPEDMQNVINKWRDYVIHKKSDQ